MKRRQSYTLIELVMVMVIMAIVAVVGYVSITSYRTQYLYAAAEGVANDLRYAKDAALSSTVWTGAVFQINPANTYTLYQTNGTTDTNFKLVNVADSYHGVTLAGVNISGGNKIEFNPYGAPFNDKTGAALTGEGLVTLAAGGSQVTVRVAPVTGKIYLQ